MPARWEDSRVEEEEKGPRVNGSVQCAISELYMHS